MVTIGFVRSVTPGKRLLRVVPESGREQYFEGLNRVYVSLRGHDEPVQCKVAEVRNEAGRYAIVLTAGTPRDMVARMKAAAVTVEVDARLLPQKGEAAADYVGLAACDETGAAIGVVTAIESSPAQDVLEIARPGGRVVRVPLIDRIVAACDWNKGRMILKDITPYAVEDIDEADDEGGSR